MMGRWIKTGNRTSACPVECTNKKRDRCLYSQCILEPDGVWGDSVIQVLDVTYYHEEDGSIEGVYYS